MKKLFIILIFFIVLSGGASDSQALILSSGISESGLGSFTGTFDYSYVDSTTGEIVISLTNTSPLSNTGFITALAFNNPGNAITGVAFSATDSDFLLIGAPFTVNDVNASPFGHFDIGASTQSGNFQGGGSPSKGLGVGASASFTFALSGTSLDTLTTASFFSAAGLSSPFSAGKGVQNFVVRYRGFTDGGSDKVVGVPSSAVPEPATLVLFSTGIAGALLRQRFLA